jgi:hypothetical protein
MFSGAGCRLSQGRASEAPPPEPAGLVELESGDPRWLVLVESCPAATAFHNPAWVHAIRQAYGYRALILALVDTRQQVRAGIPVLSGSAGPRSFPCLSPITALRLRRTRNR